MFPLVLSGPVGLVSRLGLGPVGPGMWVLVILTGG